jgi:cell fate (sporulation/competence/biofilm development) regulator YmcA (YheA/YmcA/DUF963 family)
MIAPVYEKGYPCYEAVNRDTTMSKYNQIEMRLHEQSSKISAFMDRVKKLEYDVYNLRRILEDVDTTCEENFRGKTDS